MIYYIIFNIKTKILKHTTNLYSNQEMLQFDDSDFEEFEFELELDDEEDDEEEPFYALSDPY